MRVNRCGNSDRQQPCPSAASLKRKHPRSQASSDPIGEDKRGVTAEKEARIQLWQEVEALKKSLSIAVNAERFSDAARIRDQIESLSLADDYFRTEQELKKAVKEERYTDAARLRDALKSLDPPPSMAVLTGEGEAFADRGTNNVDTELAAMNPDNVSGSSTTITAGIQVHVETTYMPEQSLPEQHRFLFSYKVTITNESKDTCQLISRHWIINSAVGPASEAKGLGVVGRQPVLEPGETFEYTSACPITGEPKAGQSILGNMRGSYQFCKGDTGTEKFDVNIDPFYFKLPFRNYR